MRFIIDMQLSILLRDIDHHYLMILFILVQVYLQNSIVGLVRFHHFQLRNQVILGDEMLMLQNEIYKSVWIFTLQELNSIVKITSAQIHYKERLRFCLLLQSKLPINFDLPLFPKSLKKISNLFY